VRKARTTLKSRAHAISSEQSYVAAEAAIARGADAQATDSAGDASDDPEELAQQYAKALAARYRLVRREHAVGCVRDRAATRIQKHVRAMAGHRYFNQLHRAFEERRAVMRMQKLARGRAGRKDFSREWQAYVARVTPYAILIQKWWRGLAPKRYLFAVRASATYIAATYRMARIRRLHMRLVQATLFLQKGGVLSKYRAGHFTGERHDRLVKLTPDLETLMWGPVSGEWVADAANAGAASIKSGKSDKSDGGGGKKESFKCMQMKNVMAVADGAKTGLMKRMKQREVKAAGAPSVVHKVLPFLNPKDLVLTSAFSVISKDRTLDFVAKDQESRDLWLSNLQMLLVNRATQDTATVMGRNDVVKELRAMSFQIGKLHKKQMAARMTLEKLPTIASIRGSMVEMSPSMSTLASEGNSGRSP